MEYRRTYIPGGTFFFTLVTYQRKKLFNDPRNINLLRQCLSKVKQQHPFIISAYVILPDHLHCIWKLPKNDTNYATRWRLIKSCFTRSMQHNNHRPSGCQKNIWQKRFWEHAIRDERDFVHHLDYIHYNPVKHGYTDDPEAWPYSSFHYYKGKEMYPENWAYGAEKEEWGAGE